ncbi:MAG: 30S ribosomal protein S12 methylthiotransferase RimO [Candidatus Kapaibacterium sp.]
MPTTANSSRSKHVHIVTLGCSKNVVDSETLMGLLRRNNITLVDEAHGADAVIINTCGFIDMAKEESVNTILDAVEMKKMGDIGQLYVAGCLSERYRSDLERDIPEVDAYFGVTDFTNILRTINPNHKFDLLGERYVPPGSKSAYLKISEGCDNPCSFCAIPLMRGGHVSRSLDDILIEAQHLASEGVRELVVVGQDTTYWGKDLFGERRLAQLLTKLGEVRGIEWIRLMYAYPSRFPHDILPVIRDTATICNYMDMPIQHVSDPVLKSMRRGLSRRTLMNLIEQIKKEVPGIALRTTLIVGYPNEGEKEFEELLEFVRFAEFDRLGVFPYSQEERTVAYDMEDPIPAEVKEERIAQIMEAQREISARKNAALVGTTQKLLVEKEVEGEYFCRSERDAPEVDGEVYITSNTLLKPGEFVEAEITGSLDYDLFGEYIRHADTVSDSWEKLLPVL